MKFLAKFFVILVFLSQGLMAAEEPLKLRIGWQIPWAVQGQLVQVLKHTDILKKHNIQAEFVGKTFGPELNEIALAGAIDVVLTADQPAAALFLKDKGWVGVSRLMYNRTTTYVPVASPIKSVADLKGKTVGVPFGAAAQRIIVESLQKNKVDTSEVKFINLGMTEHAPLIKKETGKEKWDQFDALSGFDPIPAVLEAQGLVRTIDTGKVVAMVLMNKELLAKNKDAAKKLQAALIDAYDYYRTNTKQADEWFMAEAKLEGADAKALALAVSLEPNMKVKNKKAISLKFGKEDYEIAQKGADFVSKATGKSINIKDYLSNDYVK